MVILWLILEEKNLNLEDSSSRGVSERNKGSDIDVSNISKLILGHTIVNSRAVLRKDGEVGGGKNSSSSEELE